MKVHRDDNVVFMPPSDDWAPLIRKLRWIGLDKEADRLHSAVRALPLEQRGTSCAGHVCAD
jgi:hypothetical protein